MKKIKSKNKFKIKELVQNVKFKQFISLFSVNIFSIPLSMVSSIIITKFLGAKGYGDYVFINSIFSFAVILVTFGFFQAGNRALVLNNLKIRAKEYYGASLLILIILFIILSIGLYIYAYSDTNLVEKGLKSIFLLLIPFSWIYLLLKYFETLLQADNKITLLALTRGLPKLGFFIFSVIIYLFFTGYAKNRLTLVWAFYIFSFIVSYLFVILKIKIKFSNLKNSLLKIWVYNKNYGIHIYTGSIFVLAFAELTTILISYFSIDNSGVGFFSLAVTFAAPLSLVPNVLATIYFKDFASKKKIPKKLINITIVISLISLSILWIIITPFVKYFYGIDFLPVVKLNFIVSLGVLFHGFADFFNRFLGAHGKGKSLRNSAIFNGIILLGLNILLIPRFNELGASVAKLCSGISYLFLMLFYYMKFKKGINQENIKDYN